MSEEILTKSDILIGVRNRFLKNLVEDNFDRRLFEEQPKEEKEIEARLNAKESEYTNMVMLQKAGQSVPIKKMKEMEAEKKMLEAQFFKLRVPRILALIDTMLKEEDK